MVDVILSADVRKAQTPAIKKEAAVKKEESKAGRHDVSSEERKEEVNQERSQVKKDSGGQVGRAPDAAKIIQEDLNTFDTEITVLPDSKDSATVKHEYGAHEAKPNSPQKEADSEIRSDQPSTATPPKGESLDINHIFLSNILAKQFIIKRS